MVHTSNKSSREIDEQVRDTKYKLLASCIRSDQVSAAQVWQEFRRDPEFYKWYKEEYGI
jgi:hypothetical protein